MTYYNVEIYKKAGEFAELVDEIESSSIEEVLEHVRSALADGLNVRVSNSDN